jgi:NADH-quinone oxidoreductase subunit H
MTDLIGSVAGNIVNVLVFIVKSWILVFVMMWVRWTLPRLRIDQVMMTCLRYLLPISCVLLVGVCVWQLLQSAWSVLGLTPYVIVLASVIPFVWMLWKAVTTTAVSPTQLMPGAWPGSVSRNVNRPVNP